MDLDILPLIPYSFPRPFPLEVLERIAHHADFESARHLRDMLATGSRIVLHRHRRPAIVVGRVHKFNIGRMFRGKEMPCERLIGYPMPSAAFNYPIDLGFSLYHPLGEDWDLRLRTQDFYHPTRTSDVMEPCVREVWAEGRYELTRILSPLGIEIAYSVTCGEICISKSIMDAFCNCTNFLSHDPHGICESDPGFLGTWVEVDDTKIFDLAKGPEPTMAVLRRLRTSQISNITRYAELSDDSQGVFEDLLHLAATLRLQVHFDLLEDFLRDVGFSGPIALAIAHDLTLLLEYTCT